MCILMLSLSSHKNLHKKIRISWARNVNSILHLFSADLRAAPYLLAFSTLGNLIEPYTARKCHPILILFEASVQYSK